MREFLREFSSTSVSILVSAIICGSLAYIHTEVASRPSTIVASQQQLLSTSVVNETTPNRSIIGTQQQMTPGYTGGILPQEIKSAVAERHLQSLGFTQSKLWAAGIAVFPHDSLIEKNCRGDSHNLRVSGLAIKPDSYYIRCADGQPVIPASFQLPGKCSVHYDASKSATTVGSSEAVLAHEIGHCLQFIYSPQYLLSEFVGIRPDIAQFERHHIEEIFADDYMICRHGLDTNWGEHSYYHEFGVERPSKVQCGEFNALLSSVVLT